MVYKHAYLNTLLLLHSGSISAWWRDTARRGVGGHALKSQGKYIFDHRKSWKNHGIVFLNFCGNPEFLWEPWISVGTLHGLTGFLSCNYFVKTSGATWRSFCTKSSWMTLFQECSNYTDPFKFSSKVRMNPSKFITRFWKKMLHTVINGHTQLSYSGDEATLV